MSRKSEPEALARFRIDSTLKALGWRMDGENANVRLEGHFRSNAHKRLFKGKRPDYHLYQSDSDIPIAIIEAKKPRYKKLSDGLDQAAKYAAKFGNDNMVVFCSDGAVTLARHIRTGKPPTIGGEVVQDLLPPALLEKLAQNPDLDVGQEVKNVQKMIQIFKKADNELRTDGIEGGMDSLREFCLLLFVKIMAEREGGILSAWDRLTGTRGKKMVEEYRGIVEKHRDTYADFINPTQIRTPQALEGIVAEISKINFSDSDIDIKGGAYEYFLSRYSMDRKSVLGQYFTPRHITRMIAQLINPRIGEVVYDPFCGTGGLLIACYALLKNQAKNDDDITQINGRSLFGRDIGKPASQLAKMNMILLGDGHSNIQTADSFNNPVNRQYTAVVTNIPFNMSPKPPETQRQYQLATESDEPMDSNELAVRHCLFALKPGGRAAIIVPENIGYDDAYCRLRKFLYTHCRVKAAIRLPQKLFVQYTAARTGLLLLEGAWTETTKKLVSLELKNDGFSTARIRDPIPTNDIPKLLESADAMQGFPGAIKIAATDGAPFFPKDSGRQIAAADSRPLRDFLIVRTMPTSLDPNREYAEPGIDSLNNTISQRGDKRLGRNIRQKAKIVARKGDLIIATLHTQSNNGLFGIADGEYVCTSQIVAEIKGGDSEKEYLRLMLRRVLPTLKTSDLVGRETYDPETILSLPVPIPTKATLKKCEKIVALKREIKKLTDEI